MAEFRKLALDLIVADGNVDEAEVKLLKKHLYADGKIDKDEVDFLTDLRAAVGRKDKEATHPNLDKFVLKAVTDFLLAEETKIGDDAVALVKKLAGDKKIEVAEMKKFLAKLKKEKASHAGLVKVIDEWEKKNS